jgi:excisionase family DNA binding protein
MSEQITVAEAADRTGYSEGHVRALCREGRIEARRIGKRVFLIEWESLRAYRQQMEQLGSGKFDPTRRTGGDTVDTG